MYKQMYEVYLFSTSYYQFENILNSNQKRNIVKNLN